MSAQCTDGISNSSNVQAPALALELHTTGTNNENQQLEHVQSHTSTSEDGVTLHQALDESERTDAQDNDSSSDDDEFAEEDAWLAAGHFLSDDDDDDDDDGDEVNDSERYVPQLMDTREMRKLRSTLYRSERQIATCGRMREFVPRKPAASPERRGGKRTVNSSCKRECNDASAHCIDRSITAHDDRHQRLQHDHGTSFTPGPTRAFLTAAPSTAAIGAHDAPLSARRNRKQQDFAIVLRRELQQLRELELRYDETKRMLLEQMDVVCSLKPSERTGGPETYDKLAELMAFAAQCHTSHHEH